jgi:hypothetical protein
VQRRDCGDLERTEEVEDVLAVGATPDREVVLDRDDIDAGPDRATVQRVVGTLVAPDPVMDLERKRGSAFGGQQDGDLAVTRGGGEVARERRDAAAARGVTGYEGSPCDDVGPLGRSASLRSRGRGRARSGAVLGEGTGIERPDGSTAVRGSDGAARPMDEPLDTG